jgi:catechol 2,3-dioxygenase-like lactoylglutathione lyase family enzyme
MRIHQMVLTTNRINDLAEFYRDVLSLRTTQHNDSLHIRVGESEIVFRSGEAARYHYAFNVPQNQFEAAKAWCKARVPLISDGHSDTIHHEDWNAHAVYFYDPAGNIVELIARHTLSNDEVGAFSEAQLLNVSEIGVCAESVPDAVKTVTETTHMPIYRGAGGTEFTAVGDENGLFITVRRGRIWYPNTGVPANDLPVEVTFSENGIHYRARYMPQLTIERIDP